MREYGAKRTHTIKFAATAGEREQLMGLARQMGEPAAVLLRRWLRQQLDANRKNESTRTAEQDGE